MLQIELLIILQMKVYTQGNLHSKEKEPLKKVYPVTIDNEFRPCFELGLC